VATLRYGLALVGNRLAVLVDRVNGLMESSWETLIGSILPVG